jgi:putative heme-binding domain-containing protein
MLRRLQAPAELKPFVNDKRPGVRKAALLALLETHALGEAEVRKRASDSDSGVSQIAQLWLQRTTTDNGVSLRGRPLNVPSPVAAMPGSLVGLVRNVKARGDGQYQLVPAGLRAGARPYTDRNYDLCIVPDELVGLDFIQTANEDDNSWGEGWLTFDALMTLRVYVAFDTRNTSIPRWARESFRRTGERIRADHWTFDLYSRDFAAGPVELGGNTEDGRAGGKGNYIVVLEPLPLTSPAAATTIDAALAGLANGDRDRGQWLFHARGGAGCFNCHRLGDHGNNFGPDLGALGERASARHIIESMLEPNSVITEGFNLHSVETAEFEYAGMLIEESGVTVTIGMANGEQKVIPKSRITMRRTAALSAMPAYNTVLMPQSVADITAYLLGPKTMTANTSRPTGQGFSVAERGDRLLIEYSGQPVAEFVFRDERILRPYFANVHAPSGVKVTRSHPPEAGIDAEDHDTMHPGIWLAFGDINGADFWRNKGRIEHVRFLVPPALRDNHLGFATEGRLRTAEGSLVCSLTNDITIGALSNAWLVVWDATFRSDVGDFTFGDQEEMGFGARVATSITEKNGGLLVSSTGLKTAKGTWGMPAEWCDYSGNINGQPVGITLMTHPRNFRSSWWHNRDYGVFVANPFGRAAMNQGGTSAVTVKRGENFHLRFAAALHSGHGFSPAATYLDFVDSKE